MVASILKKYLPLLKASLGRTTFSCGKQRCTCTRGKPHAAFYLSYRKAGKTFTVHVPKHLADKIGGMCKNWKGLQRFLEKETDKAIKELLASYRNKKRMRT